MTTFHKLIGALLVAVLSGCGGTGTGNPANGNVVIQSAPLAGPNAAALDRGFLNVAALGRSVFDTIIGLRTAIAAVSPFMSFTACNDTMVFFDGSGNKLSLNGSTSPAVGQGLLTFSPSSINPMAIGTLTIPIGTVLSEIDITFAVVPAICQGAAYAVEFNDGVHGTIDITQNTAFKFKFAGSGSSISDGQTLTLMFGAIVNGMAALGVGLSNSTVQTVNVGQAQ